MTSTSDSGERRDDIPKPAEATHDAVDAGEDASRSGHETAENEAAAPAEAKALVGEARREKVSVGGIGDAHRGDAHREDTPGEDTRTDAAEVAVTEDVADEDAHDDAYGDADEPEEESADERKQPLSPSQARSLRMRVAGAFMAVAAVVLVVRLSDQPSVLVMGVYGAALILCGIVIELSRRGRTRLGMWMLAGGLVAVAAADQWLRSG